MGVPPEPPAPPPPLRVPTSVFDLEADPGAVRGAAFGWRIMANGCRRTVDLVDPPASALRDGWHGRAGDGYDDHWSRLNADITSVSDHADAMAGELEGVAEELASGQTTLDQHRARAAATCPASVDGDMLVFQPADDGETAAVEAVVDEARAQRSTLDQSLSSRRRRLLQRRRALSDVAIWWAGVARGSAAPFSAPAESSRDIRTLRVGDQVIIDTGDGDDVVEVQVDAATGRPVLMVNGIHHTFDPAMRLTVRTGTGDDRVGMEERMDVPLTVLGGSGYDRVRTGAGADRVFGGGDDDRIESGGGNDRISGGGGDDYAYSFTGNDALQGGDGRDVLYGGDGHDRLSGGTDEDYVEGGGGNDTAAGGSDGDVVSGGRGHDRLFGGAGDDTVVAGAETDRVDAGRGDDTVYGERGTDTVANAPLDAVDVDADVGNEFVNLSGSDGFRQRIEADLDAFRGTPSGAEMLRSLDESHEETKAIAADWPVLGGPAYGGDVVTVHEYDEPNGGARVRGLPFVAYDIDIDINPGFRGPERGVPSSVLYHELAHAWDYTHETSQGGTYRGIDPVDNDPARDGIANGERQAVGLPLDHDSDDDTPEIVDPDHPFIYTENAIREDLGLERRDHYRG